MRKTKKTILILLSVLVLLAVPAMAAEITVQWTAPISNEDGSPLTDLDGYEACYGYGTETGVYTTCIDVGNVTTYTFKDLVPGIYLFAVKAYDTSGNMSVYSNELRRDIPEIVAIDIMAPRHPALMSVVITG